MIPRQVAEELGQPLPLFIKWDDADYGLRAGEHGYPTVTMPGTAIWHMAWSDKDDAIDWQAYFHLRNRLVVAAMHWDGDIRGLIASHFKATIKHLLCLEYSTVAIQNKAMDDFLAGPEHIFSILESALPEVRAMRKQYPDAVVLPGRHRAAAAVGKRWRKKVHDRQSAPLADRVAAGPRRGAPAKQRTTPRTTRGPQLNVATQDARWFLAVQGRRRHRHHRRRPWRRLPAAGPRQDVRTAARVAAAAAAAGPQVQPHAAGVPRSAAGAVQQAEVGDRAAAGSGAAGRGDQWS